MRKLPSNILGTAVITLAFSVVAVGTLWAGSAAFNKVTETNGGSTTTTADPQDQNPDTSAPEDNQDGADSEDPVSLSDLYELVQVLSEDVGNLGDDIDSLESARDEQALQLVDVDRSLKKLSSKLDETATNVQTVSDSVTALVPKLSKITVDGIYTGTITPAQLTRKLNTDEINGDWPLERTKGQLALTALKSEFGPCSPDSRYNVVLSIDPFRNVTCVRFLK